MFYYSNDKCIIIIHASNAGRKNTALPTSMVHLVVYTNGALRSWVANAFIYQILAIFIKLHVALYAAVLRMFLWSSGMILP